MCAREQSHVPRREEESSPCWLNENDSSWLIPFGPLRTTGIHQLGAFVIRGSTGILTCAYPFITLHGLHDEHDSLDAIY